MKNIRVFLSENLQFLEVKFSIYLNRRVYVMVGFVSFAYCLQLLELTRHMMCNARNSPDVVNVAFHIHIYHKNTSEDTEEIPQSRGTALPRHQKKNRWGTNYDITKTRLFKYIEKFTTKNWKISDKNSDIFHIYAQNIDCEYSLEPPRRGGSNGYQQSMFLSRNKKNNVYPCKPQFYYIKVGFKGTKIIQVHFREWRLNATHDSTDNDRVNALEWLVGKLLGWVSFDLRLHCSFKRICPNTYSM